MGALSVCTLYSILFMKLWSFVHVNIWCRTHQKQQKISISGKRRESFSTDDRRGSKDINGNAVLNDSKDHPMAPLVEYPDNLTLKDLSYFLLAPTLCYELNFPRTTRIRKRFLIKRALEVLVGVNIMMALFQQWMVPSVQNSFEPFSNMDVSKAVERLLKLAVRIFYFLEKLTLVSLLLDAKSFHLALLLLLNVPLVPQHVRRGPSLR